MGFVSDLPLRGSLIACRGIGYGDGFEKGSQTLLGRFREVDKLEADIKLESSLLDETVIGQHFGLNRPGRFIGGRRDIQNQKGFPIPLHIPQKMVIADLNIIGFQAGTLARNIAKSALGFSRTGSPFHRIPYIKLGLNGRPISGSPTPI